MKSLVALTLCITFASVAYSQNWPSFRGQNSAGVGDGNAPPTTWDAEKSINVLWKTPIPGLGHSSPIVWGERIFVTTAVSSAANSQFVHGPTQTPASADDNSKHSFRVYCLDKNTGRVVWEKAIYEGVPKVKRHVKASYANPTPVTDGKKLIVSFGSEGLYCFDLDGKLLWKQDLGILDGGWSSGPDFHWGFGGRVKDAHELLRKLEERAKQTYVQPYTIAILHAGLGEKAQTVKWLERAFRDRSLRPVWLKFDPRLDDLCREGQLTNLTRRVGLNP